MEYIRQTICDRCRKSVPVSDVRYVLKGKDSKMTLCSECRAKIEGAGKTSNLSKDSPQKQVYICSRCDYKFTLGPKGDIKSTCPYCGKSDSIKKCNVFSAQSLIQN